MLGVSVMGLIYGFSIPFVLIFGLVVTIGSMLGDLTESLIKRQLQFKDSGALFAGHGGVFDRLDSSFWGVLFAYYCTVLLLPVLK
jgi:phosphatidate cytidylyltransferase